MPGLLSRESIMKSQAQQAMDAGLLCEKSGNFAEAEQHYLSALRKKKNALAHIRLVDSMSNNKPGHKVFPILWLPAG